MRLPYTFALDALSAAENERLAVLMNAFGGECGCNSGSFVMSAGVVAVIVRYFATGGRWAAVGRREWLWLLAATAAFAVIGKGIGLLWARWRMFRIAGETLRRISDGDQQIDRQIDLQGDRDGTRMPGVAGVG